MRTFLTKQQAARILSALLCAVAVPAFAADPVTVTSGTGSIPWAETATTRYVVEDGGKLSLDSQQGSTTHMDLKTEGTGITVKGPNSTDPSKGVTLQLYSPGGGYYTTHYFHITATGANASALTVEKGATLNGDTEIAGTDTHLRGEKNGVSYYGKGSIEMYGGVTLHGEKGNGLEMTDGSEGTVYLYGDNHVTGGTNGMVVTGKARVDDSRISVTYIYGAYHRDTSFSSELDAGNFGRDGRQGAGVLARDYTGDSQEPAISVDVNYQAIFAGTTGIDVQSSSLDARSPKLDVYGHSSDASQLQPHDGIGVFSGRSGNGTQDGSVKLLGYNRVLVNSQRIGLDAEQGIISLKSEHNVVQGNTGTGIYAGDGGTVTLSCYDGYDLSLQEVSGKTAIRSAASTKPATVQVSGLLNIRSTDGADGTAVESAADGNGATTSKVSLNYGANDDNRTNAITGTLRAYKGGSIDVQRGENGRRIDITGDALAYGDSRNTTGGTISLYLDQDSTLTGAADTGLALYDTTWNNGRIDLTLDGSSLWKMTKSSAVTNISGNGGTVQFENGGDSLQIGTLSGTHTFQMDLSTTGSNSDMLYISQGTSDLQTLDVKNLPELEASMADNQAVRFATVRHARNGFRDGTVLGFFANGVYNDKLSIQYRRLRSDRDNNQAYNDAYNGDGNRKPTTAQVEALYQSGDLTDARNVYVVKKAKNNVNDGALTPGAITDGLWHYMAELDTFSRRTGQAVYFNPGAKNDAWVRMDYKNFGVDGVGEISGNTYELGYNFLLSDTDRQRHSLGISGSYANPSGHFDSFRGNVRMHDRYIGIYDTHEYFEKGKAEKPVRKSYWDNYLKVHRIKQDYDTIDDQTLRSYRGRYNQTAVSLSSEYGRHLNMGNSSWYWVPQGQLQLSYLGSYDYVDSQKLHVYGDHGWSLIGRLGFDLVKNLDPKLDSKLYFKASALHEFLDGGSVRTAAYERDGWDAGEYTSDNDARGTWAEVGIGYSARTGKNQYMFFDAQRDFGNAFSRTYKITASVNWVF